MRRGIVLGVMTCVLCVVAACVPQERKIGTSRAGTFGKTPDMSVFYFHCDQVRIVFSIDDADERGDMRVFNKETGFDMSYAVERTVTASGAKYRNPDNATTYLWNKGNKATVSIEGAILPPCRQITK